MLRFVLSVLAISSGLFPGAQLNYTLTYKDSSVSVIKISIEPPAPLTTPVSFVMPRSVPGAYTNYIYDYFVEHLYAISSRGEKYLMIKDVNDAPRWNYTDTGKQVFRIEYEVNLDKMERKVLPGDASIIRPGFEIKTLQARRGFILLSIDKRAQK
jgi:hypothetical protein